ncbi:MAG: hypothetical protein GF410_18145 [Chitinivibrionales bacterium]|nr:hypothetical protein [Chitinivibrionales bacterium]
MIKIAKNGQIGNLTLFLSFVLLAGCFPTQTETTQFYIKNKCSSSIVLKSTAVVHYSDGPRDEYREFTVKAGENFFLRSLGTTDKFEMTEVFKTFNVYLGSTKSHCSWSSKDDWEFSESNGDKKYTYNVPSSCF